MEDNKALVNEIYNTLMISDLFEDGDLDEKDILEKLSTLEGNKGKEVYANILQILTELEFDPATAKKEWKKILKHRDFLSEKIGRKIDFRVAMLDYFVNFNKKIQSPKIIEFKLFVKTTKMVLMDELTDVYNKRYFHIMLTREYNQAQRYERTFSLMIIDIDDFKLINDTMGHPKGDEILMELGRILKKHTRKEDTVCRIGGDEFAVIAPETSAENLLPLATRIFEEFSSIELNGRSASLSGGIGTYPADAEELEELMHLTDKLMYEAKYSGKNKIRTAQTRQ